MTDDLQVTMVILEDDLEARYQISANKLYGMVHGAIATMLRGGAGENAESKQLVSLMKVAVKGVLMMYGDKILDAFFQGKDHPKPGKGADLLEWYTDMFTKVAIAIMSRKQIELTASFVEGTENVFTVSKVGTGPIAEKANAQDGQREPAAVL